MSAATRVSLTLLATVLVANPAPAFFILCQDLSNSRSQLESPTLRKEAKMSDAQKREQIEALYARSKTHFPEVVDLTVAELERLQESEDVLLVDARNPPEQEVSMLPGAIRAAELGSYLEQDPSRTLVVYCTIGHRSGLLARKLQAQGVKVYNLKGAILSWTHAGNELVDGDGPTRRVHVAGPNWNLAAEGYKPVW
jgi:rhodanese-related sulfurtransferase